jgi:hypothetical protein
MNEMTKKPVAKIAYLESYSIQTKQVKIELQKYSSWMTYSRLSSRLKILNVVNIIEYNQNGSR